MSDWRPATPAEQAMLEAAEAGTPEPFLATVAAHPLLLPVPPGAAAGQQVPAWPTGEHDGVTYVFAFTSPEAIAACLPGQPVTYRTDTLASVAANWPDPEWLLAVDLGLPIGFELPGSQLRTLPDLAAEIETEEGLRRAQESDSAEQLTATLLKARILVPVAPDGNDVRDVADPDFPWWRLTDATGQPTLAVFTSAARLRQVLGDHEYVTVTSLQLVNNWPGPAWQLTINPETAVVATMAGDGLLALRDWLGELRTAIVEDHEEQQRLREAEQAGWAAGPADWRPSAADEDDDPEPDPELPLVLQLVIPHQYLRSYLEDGYDRAAGLVHAWRGPGRDTPERLYRRLDLLGEGSPFSASDVWVALIRWLPDADTPPEWGRGEPRMEALVVPDGATLHCIHQDGRDEPLARFDAAGRRWLPHPGDGAVATPS